MGRESWVSDVSECMVRRLARYSTDRGIYMIHRAVFQLYV